MEPERGILYYEEAFKQNQEERLFQRWINGYQTSMSFTEFKERLGIQNQSESVEKKELTELEIYEKVKGILRKE